MIGVSIDKRVETEKLIIRVGHKLWPRIETKPLHGSQRKTDLTDKYVELTFEHIPNQELEAVLLSYGEELEFVSPGSLRERIAKRIAGMHLWYSDDK